ncbi:MAG: leucine-rich repeat protein [Firmicutes bacterium]|nr:leucine-rich repeat protein [Bacillota bacterium]
MNKQTKRKITSIMLVIILALTIGLFTIACYREIDSNQTSPPQSDSTYKNGDIEIPPVNYDFFRIQNNRLLGFTELGGGQTEVTIPASVTTIAMHAFTPRWTEPANPIWAVRDVYFENGSQLNTIENHAFMQQAGIPSNLRKITFNSDSQLRTIGNRAFYNLTNLNNFIIPKGVTSIGAEAFRNTTSLTSITIPASVTSIGGMAFAGTTRLLTLEVDEGSEHFVAIGGVVYNISATTAIASPGGLRNAVIPNTVTDLGCARNTTLGRGVFVDMRTVTFEPNSQLEFIGSGTFNTGVLTSITIPRSVTEIGNFVFGFPRGVPGAEATLNSVVFEEGSRLTTIGDMAFSGNRTMSSLTIPASVTTMGTRIFDWWGWIQTIYVQGHTERPNGWATNWRGSGQPTVVWGA